VFAKPLQIVFQRFFECVLGRHPVSNIAVCAANRPSDTPADAPRLGRSAHLVTATDLLIRRVRLPAIVFRFDQDPDAIETIAKIGDEGGYFASSADWFKDVISGSHYYGPLLGCLSPSFWCAPTFHPPSSILLNLGRLEPVPDVDLAPNSCRLAIHWWTNRLHQMFGYLCDPTIFSNKQGIYDPYENQNWLLTFGQAFGLTTALEASGRNHDIQRALMNTLLDTYADRITQRRFDQLCTFDTAKAVAESVRSKMPEAVAAILMPLADRAVDGLRRVQDGFFFREQRGDNNVVVRIPGSARGRADHKFVVHPRRRPTNLENRPVPSHVNIPAA
jgi:hypothetical protein